MTRAAAVLVLVFYAGTPAGCLAAATSGPGDVVLRVAVAANFRAAAEAVAERYDQQHGTRIVFSSAATGVLAVQWQRGAPFDLLLAADTERPRALAVQGLSQDDSRCYAIGALVLLGADNLQASLADPTLSIAIANPRSAPYGAAAMAVLQRDGFADVKERRIVMGSNVQQAYQFFASGAADLALVARSLSPDAGIAIPADWHPRIEQHAIINAASAQGDAARQLLAFMQTPDGLRVLESFGYQPCS